MQKLQVNFEFCYGIAKLNHTFDFSKNNMPVALYAPNGTMKTSLARALQDYSFGRPSKDLMFSERVSVCDVLDENGSPVGKDSIFVVESINDKYSSDRISSLLASETLKAEYDKIFNLIAQKLEDVLKKLRRLSGLTKDVEVAFSEAFKVNPNAIVAALARLDREVKRGDHAELASVKYKVLFGKAATDFLTNPDIKSLIAEYTETYERIINSSKYFKKGVFNHTNAETIAKNLKSNGWFDGGHSVNLRSTAERVEVVTEEDLASIIQSEKDQILTDTKLAEKFNMVEKAVSNAELRELRDYLTDNPTIIAELGDLDQLKQKVWIGYLTQVSTDYFGLVEEYDRSEVRLREIIAAAEIEQTRWESVVDLFNSRFSVPFEVRVENKSDAILSSKSPQLAFYFEDKNSGQEKKTSREVLDSVLSNGERRALYILNIIFEVEARLESGMETFFVFDDIADSFDYKNKYAIIEYLCDIKNEKLFHLIVLTHNFDFYRSIKGRLSVHGSNRLLCSRGEKSISLIPDTLGENPFLNWKDCLDEEVKMIASIPFVRNLAEYTGNEVAFLRLTSLLHIKADTFAFTSADLKTVYDTVLQPGGFKDFGGSVFYVVQRVFHHCEQICLVNPDELALEEKITISIGIRLRAEEFLIREINDPAFVATIKSRQTSKLIREYQKVKGAKPTALASMQKVQLMTPENIHLNSFMYEPILDLSGSHLQSLYREIKALLTQP